MTLINIWRHKLPKWLSFIYGTINCQNGPVSGAINCQTGRQILYGPCFGGSVGNNIVLEGQHTHGKKTPAEGQSAGFRSGFLVRVGIRATLLAELSLS